MLAQKTNRVQTGFRLDEVTLARVKTAAKLSNVSVNEYVNVVVKDATRDIESEEEKEASRRKTEEFLDQFYNLFSVYRTENKEDHRVMSFGNEKLRISENPSTTSRYRSFKFTIE